MSFDICFSDHPLNRMEVTSTVNTPTTVRKKRTTVSNEVRQLLTLYFQSTQGRLKPREACELFNIGFENSRKLLRQLRKGESIMRGDSKKGKHRKLLPEHDMLIEQIIRRNPTISSQKIANILRSSTELPVNVSRSTIRRHRLEQSNSDDKSTSNSDPDCLVADLQEVNPFSSMPDTTFEPFCPNVAIALPTIPFSDYRSWVPTPSST